MSSTIHQWTLDVQDLSTMASFWADALGYEIVPDDEHTCHLLPPADVPAATLTVWLQPAAGPKTTKNRNHPDLRPDDGNVNAEVERLMSLGATLADVGQHRDDPFVVMRDPEGNEFCVLHHDQRP